MTIPKIFHQLWKNTNIPRKWRASRATNKRIYPDWEHILWTDETMDNHVRTQHPEFYPIFSGFNRHIMRVDVFRYILMMDFGGIYCDMDFEFLRPYDFSKDALVLSKERDTEFGDDFNAIANYFFASMQGHDFWRDCIDDLIENPPTTNNYLEVGEVTGAGLLTRVYYQNAAKYQGVDLTPRQVFSPHRTHGKNERKHYRNSGATYGFHIGAGTWKERSSLIYWKRKLGLIQS